MNIIKTTEPPETANDYVRLRRGLFDHVIEGDITWDEYCLLNHLIVRANPHTGEFTTNYPALSGETGGHHTVNRINKLLISLRRKNYIYFPSHRGSNKSFKVAINKYPLSGKKENQKQYLLFSDKKPLTEAELEDNRQNLRGKINSLAKEKSMDYG